jgi:tRNA U54 and U55 pseudouridine synthase Pus10
VHGAKAKLKDQPVTVRGRVVKVNSGIRGMNWLHLNDGTGKAADGSDDLIVVTRETANVGDTVTIKGTVRTDVKVGPGYEYAVLVNDASLVAPK